MADTVIELLLAALADDVRRGDVQILRTDAEHRALLDGLDLDGVTASDISLQRWAELLASAGELTPHSVQGAMDTFMLILTSGTSGNPEPVLLAHMMVPFAGPPLVDRFGLGADDICSLSMPLFHSAAILGGYCVALASGAVMAPAEFSASTLLAEIRSTGRGTWLTRTLAATSISPFVPLTGCASTVRNSPRVRSNGSCNGSTRSAGPPSTPFPTTGSATPSWPRSSCATTPLSFRASSPCSSASNSTSPPMPGRASSARPPTCRRRPPTRSSNARSSSRGYGRREHPLATRITLDHLRIAAPEVPADVIR